MNREQARSRLEQTSDFTFVGGRVRITDRRTLAAIAQIKASEPGHYEKRQAVAAAARGASSSAA